MYDDIEEDIGRFGIGRTPKGLPGPYGTNEGDIWSAEDSEVGRLSKERGLILIHEVLGGQEKLYTVEEDNPDPEMQDLIERAREGVERYLAAQARLN